MTLKNKPGSGAGARAWALMIIQTRWLHRPLGTLMITCCTAENVVGRPIPFAAISPQSQKFKTKCLKSSKQNISKIQNKMVQKIKTELKKGSSCIVIEK